MSSNLVDPCCLRSEVTDCNTPLLLIFTTTTSSPFHRRRSYPPVFCCLFFHIGKILNVVGWISTPGWGLYRCLQVWLHFVKLEMRGRGSWLVLWWKNVHHRTPWFLFYCHIQLWAAPTWAALNITFSQASVAFKDNPCSSLLTALHCTPTLKMDRNREKTDRKQKDKSYTLMWCTNLSLTLFSIEKLKKHLECDRAPLISLYACLSCVVSAI